jgi:segregation and condensation protein B
MGEGSRVDEHRDSLADQAAAWVPPWQRERSGETDPEAVEPEAVEPEAVEPEAVEPEAVAVDPSFALLPNGIHRSEDPEDQPIGVSDREAEQSAAAATTSAAATSAAAAISAAVATAAEAVVGAETVEGDSSAAPVEDVPVPSPATAPPAALALIDEAELRAALEAILLVVDEPVSDVVLAGVMEQPTERVTEAMAALSAGYTAEGRGFDLRRAAGGWRLYTRPEYAGYVERFVLDGQQVRLTQAALETLAVIAYKQPVTRSRISAIRGVNCDGVIRTLVNRGLVEECGTEPDSGAYLYRTTTLFLEKLGLDSVGELPPLAPFLPDDVDGIADGEG